MRQVSRINLFNADTRGLHTDIRRFIRENPRAICENPRLSFKNILLLIILFSLFILEALAKDERELRQVPTPPPPQPPQTQNRPILPPQVPTPPPTVSPTPSPHIATPPMDATLMRQTAIPPQPQIGLPTMQEIPPIPIIGNTIGKVLSMGNDEKGIPFIEIDDTLFGTIYKVKINPGRTGMVKANRIINLSEIAVGDTVNALYTEEGEEKVATFISVLTPEEIELMEQIPSETVAKPEELEK